MSSARWRSERPPTVFDWLMRHWFRNRAALTRPNFGTAISMSNTFAVDTYSGGLLRICSIRADPDLRSFLSCARLTRMSFARLRASIRWSRERRGACAWVLRAATARGILTSSEPRSTLHICRCMQVFFAVNARPAVEGWAFRLMSGSYGVVRIGEAERRQLGSQLATNTGRGAG